MITRALSYIGAEKITFPPKHDGQTDIQTDRWTDIIVYRVASLLLKNIQKLHITKNNMYMKKVKLIKKTRVIDTK